MEAPRSQKQIEETLPMDPTPRVSRLAQLMEERSSKATLRCGNSETSLQDFFPKPFSVPGTHLLFQTPSNGPPGPRKGSAAGNGTLAIRSRACLISPSPERIKSGETPPG